jgi:hypothetical protein
MCTSIRLRLPAQPPGSLLTCYPNAVETGLFTFYQNSFLAGQPGEYAVNYSYDELNNFFQLTARRSSELRVVSVTSTAAHERRQVEHLPASKPPASSPSTGASSPVKATTQKSGAPWWVFVGVGGLSIAAWHWLKARWL